VYPAELDHLHAIAQRRRDRVEDVRRGDEHHTLQSNGTSR
jgi:hypothetical protein